MDVWRDMGTMLGPAIKRRSETEKRMELTTGGVIDFWTLDTPDAGRGRKYHEIVLDECGIVRNLTHTWQASIRPTLTDYKGSAWFLGTPKGRREFHELYSRGEQGLDGWAAFRSPTSSNPAISRAEIEAARRDMPEAVFRQEYEGIPADDGGNPFGITHIQACFGPVPQGDAIVYGIDLAKSQDWTVVVGLSESGDVVEFHRWQGAPWGQTIERLTGIVGRTPALVDRTGVGDPIVDTLQETLPCVEGFSFTQQSKQMIMQGLAVAIQRGSVKFDDTTMKAELESFGYEYVASGVRYSAPDGLHDDCVCALALAVHHLRANSSTFGVSLPTPSVRKDPNFADIYVVDQAAEDAERLRRFALGL